MYIYIYIYIYIYLHIKYVYITPILLLWNLTTSCVVHLRSSIYVYKYIYKYILHVSHIYLNI